LLTSFSSNSTRCQVVDTTSGEMWFKVKRSTKMSKIVSAYCGRAGRAREVVRFTYDGNRLKDEDTPDSLGMEENDSI
ncbi:hypothetical protein BDY24DRAFT_323931, partial [Mrakia frigida]|uniref:uncharacterized protein n=1 Tax=Mrakia frigida TaxID=29902 RepID=UPI003FCC10E2